MKLFMKRKHSTGVSKTSHCTVGLAKQLWCQYDEPNSN